MSTPTAALSVDELREAAVAKAGHDRFGDEWFLEPLEVLVDALNREAALSELGLQLTRKRLTALLVDRLRLRDYQRANPEVLAVEPDVGAVICGLPRTGSTLMHRLLASSPQLTATLSWETSYPLPFPDEGATAEIRKDKAKRAMEAMLELAPDFADIHDVVWDGPEEDVILGDRTFLTMSFDSFYRVPSYGDYLRSVDQRPALRELREWLQALQHQAPEREGQRWVLKSPHYLTGLEAVLDVFDASRVVMTHRTPVRAVPSYASMVTAMASQYSDAIDPTEVGPYWRDRFAGQLADYDRVRRERPDRFVDVRFADTMAAPTGEAERVLAALDREVGEDDRAAFTAYVERDREQRSAAHSYTPEEYGLDEDGLAQTFHHYMETYL